MKQEWFSGESKNIEYKITLPDKSEKYMKTVIAFANTQGGKLIIGIDDKTHEVLGVDNETLFETMDRIANAVSDSCIPQIIPEIEPLTIEGKTVIIVTVEAGKNRPYYLKSKGKENGTYIRVAGTSRQAFPEKIKELEMEGARISWDELTCVGYPVSEDSVNRLCNDIENFRKKAGMPEHYVALEQLINWKILKKKDDQLIATNAFALLTSNYFEFSKTQCAVFKGTDRAVFLDKREFNGPIYNQIEESCIQVAVYDDRLEVTSPGGLYNGLTYEEVLNGHSKIRNKGLANIFSQMGLVEAWGSGIKRIFYAAREYGLQEPKIQEFDNMFRIELFRNNAIRKESNNNTKIEKHRRNIGEASEKHRRKELNDTQKKIIKMLSKNNRLSARQMSEQIGISSRNIENNIRTLKKQGMLIRHGSPKNGYWEIP